MGTWPCTATGVGPAGAAAAAGAACEPLVAAGASRVKPEVAAMRRGAGRARARGRRPAGVPQGQGGGQR